MQMAKTCVLLAELRDAKIPYISILTNPTTGGVTASFASLGDVIVAEPQALVGFAGPRVIRQTIRQELPEGFQSAEFIRDHGFLDIIAPRAELRKTLSLLLEYMCGPQAGIHQSLKEGPAT
jgi:acetyl-CoA carboxylase carboxyl transferase subunit beta